MRVELEWIRSKPLVQPIELQLIDNTSFLIKVDFYLKNKLFYDYYSIEIVNVNLTGIEPHVTLYHFDLPQSLEDAYDGWLNLQIV